MRLHDLANRLGLLAFLVFLERFDVRRRRRGRRAQQVLQNVGAAQHRRGAIGIRRHHQDRRLAQQAEAVRIGQRHAAELIAAHVRHAVVLRRAARSGRCSSPTADRSRCGLPGTRCRGTAPSRGGSRRAAARRTPDTCTGRARAPPCRAPAATGMRNSSSASSRADPPACGAPAPRASSARSACAARPASAVPRRECSTRGRTTAATRVRGRSACRSSPAARSRAEVPCDRGTSRSTASP